LVLTGLPSVTADEVLKLLLTLPPKSSRNDFIPTSLLKSCAGVFSELIAYLANLSFSQGCFPARFKTAIITPLLKKPGLDKSSPASYRPISNLNTFSKILERLFLTRFQPHVTVSQNFNCYQSAYRRNHSTETALLATLDSVLNAADHSRATVLAALDLSAAFDMVDHGLFLSRLQTSFGVDGLVLEWIKSYLSGRSQIVSIGKSISSSTPCILGVPQGSVLGPLFFTLYISPISQVISNHGISHQQFADDTQLFISVSPSDYIYSLAKLEACLNSLHLWFCFNGLSLNPDKSECIILGSVQRTRTLPSFPHVNVAGTSVNFSPTIKTLGVIVDSNLTFDSHVQTLCKSCYYHIRALRHIRSSITTDTAKSIACAIVGSRLDYANSLLFGISNANLSKLQRVQNTLARTVLNSNLQSMDSGSALKHLHWLPVNYRIQFKIASLTYKILSTQQPVYLYSLLSNYLPTRSLRSSNSNLLTASRVSSVIGSRAFRHCAPKIWNSLPLDVRLSKSVSTFRSKLKTYFFTQP